MSYGLSSPSLLWGGKAAADRAAAKRDACPKVYFSMTIGGEPVGDIVMELRSDICPKTCENFRCLCTGEKGNGLSGKPLHFKGSVFHRVIPGFMCHGGDITKGTGGGGESIYGAQFEDENFKLQHAGPGTLSMGNGGPNTNSSLFFLSMGSRETGSSTNIMGLGTAHLDGKHVVFGAVVEGMEVLEAIGKVGNAMGKPSKVVMIEDCGMKFEPAEKSGLSAPVDGHMKTIMSEAPAVRTEDVQETEIMTEV